MQPLTARGVAKAMLPIADQAVKLDFLLEFNILKTEADRIPEWIVGAFPTGVNHVQDNPSREISPF